MTDDPLSIVRTLGVALDHVGAAWAVGGSMASSVHGIPRTTADVDLIVALRPSLAAAFSNEARGVLRRRRRAPGAAPRGARVQRVS